MRLSRFAAYAWAVLAANLLVILWGAYVRASGSGAGCGSHWPLCNGAVVPRAPEAATIVEFTHRLTSGIALLLVLAMLVWALARNAPTAGGSLLRRARAGFSSRPWSWELRGAALAMAFMISEALVGAGLVVFGLVADNASMARAVVLGIHLVNTFFLVAFVALTAWWASGAPPVRVRGQGAVGRLMIGAVAGLVVLGVTGAVTALGDTLFPSASLAEGVRQDLDPGAHFLVRLRVIHPLLAIALGLYLLVAAGVVRARRTDRTTRVLASAVIALFFVQLGAGTVNLLLLAPVWMQLVHLLLADAVWIATVLLAASALRVAPAGAHARAAAEVPAAAPLPRRARAVGSR